jgi:hypothetical protein
VTVNVPNSGTFQQSISNVAVSLRDTFANIVNLDNYITSVGGETFLTTAVPNGIGLSTEDAATVISTLGNLAALAAIYSGGAPGAALNYEANSEPLWGGS